MASGSASHAVEVRLAYSPPCDVRGLIRFLAARAVPGIEVVSDHGTYHRSLRLPHGAGVIALADGEGAVEATLWLDDRRDVDTAVASCRRLLDLDTEPAPIVDALTRDDLIGAIVQAAPGRRVPGSTDANELAIRAVLGQQISLAGAATLAARLVAAYGEPLERPHRSVTHLFPSAAAVAGADPERLAMPGSRRRALLGLAAALTSDEIPLDRSMPAAEVERRLLALPGIGPWTVGYIARRALGDPDAFMPSDLGVRHGLERLGCDGRPPSAVRIAERWRPYRAYAMQHLWAQLAPPGLPASHAAAPPARPESHAAAPPAVPDTQ